MSDDADSNVVHLPPRDSSGPVPDAPDIGDLFFSEPTPDREGSTVPEESPEETTLELPPIPEPVSPEAVLRDVGIPRAPDLQDDAPEGVDGEYEQPRSLVERLGDWLEYRIELGRERMESEAPYREAEIARKVALLESRTSRQISLLEAQNKLDQARLKSQVGKAGPRGKSGASSGLGTDKGRTKAGGNRSASPGGSGTGRGPGRPGNAGVTQKKAEKPSGGPPAGRNGAGKGNRSPGSLKGRQGGTSGSKSSKSRGGSRTPRRDGSKTKGVGAPVSSRAERTRGRQERAAARQAAGLAERAKDRDQRRARRQALWKQGQKAERKATKRKAAEKAAAAADRTTLGAAVAEEAQRRWNERRGPKTDPKKSKDDSDASAGAPKPESTESKGGPSAAEPESEDDSTNPKAGPKKPKGSPTDPKSGSDADEAPPKPSSANDDGAKDSTEADPPTGGEDRKGSETPEDDNVRSRWRRRRSGRRQDSPSGPVPAESVGITVDRPDRETPRDDRRPRTAPAPVTTGAKGLPPAPEPHSQRPGTTRSTPDPQETTVTEVRRSPRQSGLAAKHRTDITFDEYLIEMVNIALEARLDKERADALAEALGKVADALRDMAADLADDHNIDPEFVDQVLDLADSAAAIKKLATQCATDCEDASEAARLAAVSVGRVYGEDIRARDDAGLTHASAAAHHD